MLVQDVKHVRRDDGRLKQSSNASNTAYTQIQLRHWHTLVIVTDTHQHVDRDLYTYMTSYLAQAYRLSID
jgi:hypothetical protein